MLRSIALAEQLIRLSSHEENLLTYQVEISQRTVRMVFTSYLFPPTHTPIFWCVCLFCCLVLAWQHETSQQFPRTYHTLLTLLVSYCLLVSACHPCMTSQLLVINWKEKNVIMAENLCMRSFWYWIPPCPHLFMSDNLLARKSSQRKNYLSPRKKKKQPEERWLTFSSPAGLTTGFLRILTCSSSWEGEWTLSATSSVAPLWCTAGTWRTPKAGTRAVPTLPLGLLENTLPFGDCCFGKQSVRRDFYPFLCFTPVVFSFPHHDHAFTLFICLFVRLLFCQCWCWTHRHLYWNWRHARRPGGREQSGRLWLCRQAKATEVPDGSSGGTCSPSITVIPFAFWLKSFCGGNGDLKRNPNSSQLSENSFLFISWKLNQLISTNYS